MTLRITGLATALATTLAAALLAASGTASATGYPIGQPTPVDGGFSCRNFDTANLLTEMTVTPVDGIDYTEDVPTELGIKLEAAFSGWLIKETDCDVIADALLSSKALRDAIYGAAASLQAEFIAKKKSSSSTSPEK